jgi:hypothetical protein
MSSFDDAKLKSTYDIKNINYYKDYAKNESYYTDAINYFENLENKFTSNMTIGITSPIFYLFDNNINQNIYSTLHIRNNIRNNLDLDNLFNIDKTKLVDVGISHATIIYSFINNERKYIYYSNSGLGVKNHIYDIEGKAVPKIYYINDSENKLHSLLPSKIKNAIEKLIQIKDIKKEKEAETINANFEIFCNNLDIITDIDKEDFKLFITKLIKNRSENMDIYLCYILLNYCANKLSSKITECSFNHVLTGFDNDKFTKKIKLLSSSDKLEQLYENCYNDYNFIKNKSILDEQIKDVDKIEQLHKINSHIDDINSILNEYRHVPTIDFKLKSFKLEYNYISGIFNNTQKAGSCTFYSYYNLAINMLLLHSYNSNDISIFIDGFMKFHYQMIYLFCLSNDTDIIAKSNLYYSENNLVNNAYLYKIIKDSSFLDEIVDFYNKDTFLLSKSKPIIDKLLNFKNTGIINKLTILTEYKYENIFDELYSYLNDIIHQIRTKIESLDSCIFQKIQVELTSIISNIKLKLNNDALKGLSLFTLGDFDTLNNIYLLNLIHLYESYNNKCEEQLNVTDRNVIIYVKVIIPKGDISLCIKPTKIAIDNDNCYNHDILTTLLSNQERINISKKIDSTTIGDIQSNYNLVINNCGYITYKKIPLITNTDELLKNTLITMVFGNIKHLFIQYYTCIQYINNDKIAQEIRNYYIKIKENIIKNTRENINKYIVEIDNNTSLINKLLIMILILIISDNKYLLVQYGKDVVNNYTFTLLYSIINTNTKIIICNTPLAIDIITYCKKFIDGTFNIEIIGITYDKIKWINKLNFLIEPDNLELVTYESNKYCFTNFIKNRDIPVIKPLLPLVKEKFTNINLILSRFGFNNYDADNYFVLFPEFCINEKKTESANKCFLLIKKFKKCIEINFNSEHMVDINNCYLFDEHTKINKSKLIFNLNLLEHPFMTIIPQSVPYLCYYKNSSYFIDIIITGSFKENSIQFEKKEEEENIKDKAKNSNIKFDYYSMQIAPSLIFPTIDSFNIKIFNFLYEFYYGTKFSYPSELLNEPYINAHELIKYYSNLEVDIKILLTEFEEMVTFNHAEITRFESIVNSNIDATNRDLIEARKTVIKNFLDENRLCTVLNNNCILSDSKTKCSIFSLKFKNYLDEILKSIIINSYTLNFIMDNFNKFILVMILNIIINNINNVTKMTSCWDIQESINILKNCLYFIEYITDDSKKPFYNFELYFLLQNTYIYKKNQIIKYKEIINDLLVKNDELSLHQFMMGKGKTSIITPLLAFAINLLTDKKQPTIITASHLVKQTKKVMLLTEFTTKINVNVFSDFDAKKRWLENTDLHLKSENTNNINLSNEYNIIDEFDSHHNYLQSMFNFVRKEELYIDKDLFMYIFRFILKKNDSAYTDDNVINPTQIKNINILNENLNICYEQIITMKYNKDFGFEFLNNDEDNENNEDNEGNDDKLKNTNVFYRICTPFIRKNTPVKNSNFSDILLRLLLIFNLYIRKFQCQLQIFDFENIVKNKSIIDNITIPNNYYIKLYDELLYDSDVNVIKKIFIDMYLNTPYKTHIELLVSYLYFINLTKLKITNEQINMSFQDIIFNNYGQWQVGYSGTTTIKLNNYLSEDKFVFRKIIEDYDEKVEVTLAFKKMGRNIYRDDFNVMLINKIDDNSEDNLDKTIGKIINLLTVDGDIPRGFVDLAGLFLDYSNIVIAEKIKSILKDKNIVYINEKNTGIEYDPENYEKKYTHSHEDNFYYYDQSHTVGTDLKQPRTGHIAIIINRTSRMTDFAQAIFRFRKLNRGTYMSIIFINDNIKPDILTNNDVHKLLTDNEISFNTNQEDGLKYQLLKTIVRKYSHDYFESDLEPEFFKSVKFDMFSIISIIQSNIKNINDIIYIPEEDATELCVFIKELYRYFKEMEFTKLKTLVIGINSIESNVNFSTQQEAENVSQAENVTKIDKITAVRNLKNVHDVYGIKKLQIIKHFNCNLCSYLNCTKLFSNNNFTINDKQIYISYNFLEISLPEHFHKNDNDVEVDITFNNHVTKLMKDRICFIEYNNMILIEREDISIAYYISKLPVYNFEGTLLVPYMCNNSILNKYKLDIHPVIVKMLGIKNYINPIRNKYEKITNPLITSAASNINYMSLVILAYHLYVCNDNRYNISHELYNEIVKKIANKPLKPIELIDSLEHTQSIDNNIEKIYFQIYEANLKLNDTGYDITPPKNNFCYVYEYEKFTRETLQKITSLKEKYLKYKNKYINLKTKLNLN